jgi:hypothetical protein
MPLNPDTQEIINAINEQTTSMVAAINQATAVLNEISYKIDEHCMHLHEQIDLLPRSFNTSIPPQWKQEMGQT